MEVLSLIQSFKINRKIPIGFNRLGKVPLVLPHRLLKPEILLRMDIKADFQNFLIDFQFHKK